MKKRTMRAALASLTFVFTLTASFGALALTPDEKALLTEIRSGVFGGARLNAALCLSSVSGEEPPIFPLEVEDRGLLVWKIHDEYAESFALEIGLAPPFTLSKIGPLTARGSQTLAGRLQRFLEARGLDRWLARLYPQHYYVIADIGNTQRAETGAKLEFKTFVQLPGDPTPRLFRFSSHKAIPGVDLLQLSSNVPAALGVTAAPGSWSGRLDTDQGSLSWSVPVRNDRNKKHSKKRGLRFSEAFLDAGEQAFGPMGATAKYFYDGSSVSGGLLRIDERRVDVENTFSWGKYLAPGVQALVLDTLTEYLVRPITAPVQVTPTGGPVPCSVPADAGSGLFASLVGLALSGADPQSVFGQLFQSAGTIPPQQLATLYYALLDLYQGLGILTGMERPKLSFGLLESPSTIFINFEIPRNKVRAFEEAFLPNHFRLAKIRFYPEQRKAVYAVSLNVYQSVGPNISGFRAEWSTYVINPAEENPSPRFSVLEAQTNVLGFDAVEALERYKTFGPLDLSDPNQLGLLFEPPSEVFTYMANETDGIQLNVLDVDEQIAVDVSIAYPPRSRILKTAPTTRWMEANDFVYWGEVADILKYDSKVMFAELLVFEAAPGDRISDTTFADYVKPDPLPIIIWNGPQDIALEPWGNLDTIVPTD